MEDAPKLLKIPKSESPDIWIRLPRQMAWIMVQYGRPSRTSWAKSVWSSFGRTVMEKAIWENPIEIRLGESFLLGMLIRTPWKRIILISVCGWHQIGWKETKYGSDVESAQQRSWFGRTNIIPWSWNLECTQRQCEISKDIVDNYRTMFESRISAGAKEKLPCSENLSISSWSYDMEGQEMCGTMLWVGKQDDSTTLQSINSMPWWPSLQRRRIEIRGRIVKSVLSNWSGMLKLGTYWKTRYSVVSEQTCTINH